MKPIAEGKRGKKIKREFYLEKTIPDPSTVMSAFGFCFSGHKLILVNEDGRGRDLPGGHREKEEDFTQTVIREAREEAGFIVEKAELVAYRKLICSEPIPNKHSGGHYPFPVSYVPQFICTTSLPLQKDGIEEEINDIRAFTLPELAELEPHKQKLYEEIFNIYRCLYHK